VLIFVRAGALGWARPLPIRSEGRVLCERRMTNVGDWVTASSHPFMTYDARLLLGLGRLGLSLLMRCEPCGLLRNRCLEIPQGYNPNSSP
jgi:hypothetical protein